MTKSRWDVVGFTGTRKGITEAQAGVLRRLMHGVDELHHGDCVGADAAAHDIAVEAGVHKIVAHPCTIHGMRANMDAHVVLDPLDPLIRNRVMVDVSNRLIACPAKDGEEVRSGTWATIRYARKQHKPTIIITPAGEARGE